MTASPVVSAFDLAPFLLLFLLGLFRGVGYLGMIRAVPLLAFSEVVPENKSANKQYNDTDDHANDDSVGLGDGARLDPIVVGTVHARRARSGRALAIGWKRQSR